MTRPLLEVSFLIPTVRDSDRRPHQPLAWTLLQDEIRHSFPKGHSGPEIFHRAVDQVPGDYADDENEPVEDLSRRYTLALPSEELDALRELLGKTATTFDQRAIYLSIGGHVEFIGPDSEGRGL